MIFMLRRTVTFYSQKSFVGCIFVQCTLIVRHSNIHINDNRSTKNHTQNMKKKRKKTHTKHTQRKMLRSTLTIDESLGTLKKFTVLLDFGGPPSNYTRYKIRFRFFFFLISFFCFRFHFEISVENSRHTQMRFHVEISATRTKNYNSILHKNQAWCKTQNERNEK